RFERAALLRGECKNQGRTSRRVSSRAARGFFLRICLRRAGECAFTMLVRQILTPSSRGNVQGVRARVAICGGEGQAVEERAAQHERAAMNVAILDYGAGNVPSVERALQKLGASSERVSTADKLENARAIVLPGVGHYAALIRGLDERELRATLVGAILRGTPFLGICLGLQALYRGSEESPALAGLGIFPGKVCGLPSSLKLPHMGWNRLKIRRGYALLNGLSGDDYFYFAH